MNCKFFTNIYLNSVLFTLDDDFGYTDMNEFALYIDFCLVDNSNGENEGVNGV